MRKIKTFSLIFVLIVGVLCGCSVGSVEFNVETLKGWSFQFNEGTNDYSLFFGLLDKNGNYLSADGSVDILIVNEKDE